MTLFLFVIMLIGVDKDEDRSEDIPFQRPLTLILLGLFAGGVLVAGARAWTTGTVSPTDPVNGTIEAIGESLFGDWVLPFEVTALLLIIAAAGTIALAFFGGDDEEEGS
jgi:NADH-quinone oxidoreductase subunit J